jgi:hypothetical protein
MGNLPLIEIVKNTLQQYSGIRLEQQNVNELVIENDSENGFSIALKYIPNEYILFLNEFNKYFENTEEDHEKILDIIYLSLTGMARLKEFSKNGHNFKWTLQVKHKNQEWQNYGTSVVFNINFWTKSQIKYLQNDPLIIEKIFI